MALTAGDPAGAESWIVDARRRCDRVPDRYVWVSAYVALAQVEIAASNRDFVAPLAVRLRADAVRFDLPELLAWALVYGAEVGDATGVAAARAVAQSVTNPPLHARPATV